MSICRGVAGLRGGNPRGIFIHNDAGSQNANAAFYRKWSQTHPLENGFAHAYVASDEILYAEDDAYAKHGTAGRQTETRTIIRSRSVRVWGIWKSLGKMKRMR